MRAARRRLAGTTLGLSLAAVLTACTGWFDEAWLRSMTDPTPSVPTPSAAADGCYDEPARGITIEAVHLYQSLRIPLATDGTVIDPNARIVDVVAGKDAVISVDVGTGPDWATRSVAARVSVLQASGSEVVRTRRFLPDEIDQPGSSGPDDAHVDVPADEVRADTRVAVTVVECDPAAFADRDSGEPVAPSGAIDLAARTTGAITIHLIPFEVGGFVPSTAPAVLEGYRAALLAMYPVTAVDITVSEVVAGGDTPDLGELLVSVGRIRDQDRPTKDVYYYGMVSGAPSRAEYCDDCITGTSEAGTKDHVGFAIGAAFGDPRSEETMLHELGHAHGLLHAPCGDPDMVDETFPYEDGAIGVPGYDRRTGEVVPASASDLMGYCSLRWISDHHYQRLVERVAEVHRHLADD